MQVARWLTFGFIESALRTIVHLFPSSGSVGAPQPVNCKVSMFARSLAPRSVVLEGARLGQPDGVRLEELFGTPQELAAGPVGVEIELSTTQGRIDLSPSSCLIEVAGLPYPVRFASPCLALSLELASKESDRQQLTRPGILGFDSFSRASLMVVNGSDVELRPDQLDFELCDSNGKRVETSLLGTRVPPFSVVEVRLNESVISDAPMLPTSKGSMKAFSLASRGLMPESVALFVLNRNVQTGLPLSAGPL